MDEKDFMPWFEKKPRIHAGGHRPFVHERELWWCYLGTNIGSEQDGSGYNVSRPVLVYRKFNKRICWVIPITTVEKQNALYVPIDDAHVRFALIHQMRVIDTKRLYECIGKVSDDRFSAITTYVSQVAGTDWDTKTSTAALMSAAVGPKPSP